MFDSLFCKVIKPWGSYVKSILSPLYKRGTVEYLRDLGLLNAWEIGLRSACGPQAGLALMPGDRGGQLVS